MNVYSICFDANIYQSLVPEDLGIWKTNVLLFDGTPKLPGWNPPSFRIYQPKLKKGDFFGVVPGTVGVAGHAVDLLRQFFEMSGEILPILPTEFNISCLNVTECCDCLDHDKAEWVYGQETKKTIRIKRFVFKRHLIPETSLFKIPELAKAKILTHKGMLDSENNFKANLERLGLTGLKFGQIWSDD